MKNFDGRQGFLAAVLCVYVVIQNITRLIITTLSWQQVSWSFGELLKMFGLGLFYDVAAGLCFTVPLGFLLFLLPTGWLVRKRGRYLVGALTGFISFFNTFLAGIPY